MSKINFFECKNHTQMFSANYIVCHRKMNSLKTRSWWAAGASSEIPIISALLI